jgi:predicted RNA-binding protein (virulence factor B family)
VPETYQIDDILEVFIYRDSEDRIIATTLKPFATINQFAYLEVHSVTPLGVFLEWGLAKHLFVPFSQQFQKMTVGRSYLVYIYLDAQTDRIVASARVEKFLPVVDAESLFTIGDKIEVIPFEYTDLGIKCLVNNCVIGLLFKNQVFTKVTMGESMPVYVYNIRPDDKLDLRIEPVGLVRMDSQMTKLMAELKANNGVLMLHDKSPAELIYDQLGMSKKDFKKAVGGLYKSKQLAIHHDCISLL